MSEIRQTLESNAQRLNNGVIERAKASAAGLPKSQIDRRVRRRQWRPSGFRGWLILADHWDDPVAHLGCACGALGGVAWRRSAMALHGLAKDPPKPEVLSRSQHRSSLARISRYDASVWRVAPRRGIWCLTVEDTVASMAGVSQPDRFDELIDRILLGRQTSWQNLATAFKRVRRQGRLGSAQLGRVLEEREQETAVPLSIWSRKFSRALEDAGLPKPEMEWRVDRAGRLIAQVDLAYPKLRYALELDSVAYHLNRTAFEEDRRRDAELAACGWLVRRFTWAQFDTNFSWVLSVIRADLTLRASSLNSIETLGA